MLCTQTNPFFMNQAAREAAAQLMADIRAWQVAAAAAAVTPDPGLLQAQVTLCAHLARHGAATVVKPQRGDAVQQPAVAYSQPWQPPPARPSLVTAPPADTQLDLAADAEQDADDDAEPFHVDYDEEEADVMEGFAASPRAASLDTLLRRDSLALTASPASSRLQSPLRESVSFYDAPPAIVGCIPAASPPESQLPLGNGPVEAEEPPPGHSLTTPLAHTVSRLLGAGFGVNTDDAGEEDAMAAQLARLRQTQRTDADDDSDFD
jgi:hypothetical protein